jgi:hypothetical protein
MSLDGAGGAALGADFFLKIASIKDLILMMRLRNISTIFFNIFIARLLLPTRVHPRNSNQRGVTIKKGIFSPVDKN